MTTHPRPDDAARAAELARDVLTRIRYSSLAATSEQYLTDALLTFAAQAAQRVVDDVPVYGCDCLPSGPNGEPSDEPGAIYCHREIVLLSDLKARHAATQEGTT